MASHSLTCIAASTRPASCHSTIPLTSARSPRTTTLSVCSFGARPTYSMPRSYWSVKKYGARSYATSSPSMLRAATLPCSIALSQCSTRTRCPSTRMVVVGDVADGVHVRVGRAQPGVDEHAVVRGEPGRLGERGPRRRADGHDDAARRAAPRRRRPAPGPARRPRRTPRAGGRRRARGAGRRRSAPIRSPITPSSGCDCGSTTVTSQPIVRAAAATSRPIQPAPTITTRGCSWSADRREAQSSRVRR